MKTTMMLVGVILLSIIAVSECALSHDPRVSITETVPESDTHLVLGTIAQDVTLNCFVENKPELFDVRWMRTRFDKNGKVLDSMSITQDMSSDDVNKWSIEKPTPYSWRLRIKALQIHDEATYSCYIQLNLDTKVAANKTVRATDPPRIVEGLTSSDKTIAENDKDSLNCNATGRPIPTLTWRREGNDILPGGGVISYSGKLIIDGARAQDRGRYICEAINIVGFAERAITLSVLFAPQITVDSPVVTQVPGYRRTLICFVDANPQPRTERDANQLTWLRDSVSVMEDPRVKYRVITGARSRLTFELVFETVQSEDYGQYACRARTAHGTTVKQIRLERAEEPQLDKGILAGASHLQVTMTTVLFTALLALILH